jgi:hypothetical protein
MSASWGHTPNQMPRPDMRISTRYTQSQVLTPGDRYRQARGGGATAPVAQVMNNYKHNAPVAQGPVGIQRIRAAMGTTKPETGAVEYSLVRGVDEPFGYHLIDPVPWPGSVEAAIAYAEKECGLRPGHELRFVQNYQGETFYYARASDDFDAVAGYGSNNGPPRGENLQNTWRVDPVSSGPPRTSHSPSSGGKNTTTQSTSSSSQYRVTRGVTEQVGYQIATAAWPGSIEAAIAYCEEELGKRPGSEVRYIQRVKEDVFYYGDIAVNPNLTAL